MRKCILTLLSVLAFSSLAFGQISYSLPQIAHIENAIETTFLFFNNGNQTALVTMTLTDDPGNPLNMSIAGLPEGNVKAFSLAPGETKFFKSQGAGLFVGAARVSSNQQIGVSAIFSILGSGGSLVTEAGIGASPESNQVVIAIDKTGAFNTGIAIFNPQSSGVTLTFQLFSSAGTATGSAQPIQIPAKGHKAIFIDAIYPGLGQFKGRLVITATLPVAILTLRQNTATGNPLTSLPSVASTSKQTMFSLPQVVNIDGFKTQFLIFNLGDTQGTVNLYFTDDMGQPKSTKLATGETGSEMSFTVPAKGAVFKETNASSANFLVGAARIESDIPVGVTAVLSQLNASKIPIVEAGVGDSPAYNNFTLPVDTRSGFNTGVALFNNNASGANINLTLLDEGGEAVESVQFRAEPFDLLPMGHAAKYVTEFFEGTGQLIGQLAITSDQPLSALTLRQKGSLLTTLPVVDGVTSAGGGPGLEGTQLLHTTVKNVSITSNTTLNQQLKKGYKLSGDLTVPDGFFGSSVQATDGQGNTYVGQARFDFGSFPFDGPAQLPALIYEVIVPAGTFDVRTCSTFVGDTGEFGATTPLQDGNSSYFLGHVEPGVTVAGDTTKDITVPPVSTTSLSGTVTNLAELPPGSVDSGVSLVFSSADAPTQALAAVAANGAYQVDLAPGSYIASLFFGEGIDTDDDQIIDEYTSSASLFNIGGKSVSSLTAPLATANFAVPDLIQLNGNISQPNTANMIGKDAFAADKTWQEGTLIEQCFPAIGGSFGSADAAGNYQMRLIANRTYNINASVPATSVGTDEEGILWAPRNNEKSYSANSTLNFALPAFPQQRTLSGKVTDENGLPVENVNVEVFTDGGLTGTPDAFYSASTMTDAQGNYSLTVLSGTQYIVTFDPPLPGSSFPF